MTARTRERLRYFLDETLAGYFVRVSPALALIGAVVWFWPHEVFQLVVAAIAAFAGAALLASVIWLATGGR